jgi:hypothetical protein
VVKVLVEKIRPGRGFAHFFHLILVGLLPIVVYLLVRLEFNTVALLVILLSKWRMFAINPRHWLAHIRTNGVDIIANLSFLTFMIEANSMSAQLVWLVVYELWVLWLKPGSGPLRVGLQALIGQFVGLTALFIAFQDVGLYVFVVGVAAITYLSSRHFFGGFEEEYANLYSWIWCFFSASLVWLLGHWLLFYGPIAQPAVLLSVIGYGLVSLYYLDETDRLSRIIQRQVLFVMTAVVVVIIAFSNWGDTVIK